MAKNNYTNKSNSNIITSVPERKVDIMELIELDEVKSIEVIALDVEDTAIMIMVGGWVRRVYFDLSWNDKAKWLENYKHYKGRNFTINYVGDFNDAHTVKLLPIKSIE